VLELAGVGDGDEGADGVEVHAAPDPTTDNVRLSAHAAMVV